jgi:hypothetical protein
MKRLERVKCQSRPREAPLVAQTAQGGQRRSSNFNIDRDLSSMRINRFTSAFACLFAVTISTANVIAEQAGSTNPPEQTVYQTKGIVLEQCRA